VSSEWATLASTIARTLFAAGWRWRRHLADKRLQPIAYISGSLGVRLARIRSIWLRSLGSSAASDPIIAVLLARSGGRLTVNKSYSNLWRFCHIGPQTPVEEESQVDSSGAESYSPLIVNGGGVTRVAYGVAPQRRPQDDESLA
jgi:hypothetical protein